MGWVRRIVKGIGAILLAGLCYLAFTAGQVLYVAGHDTARVDEPAQAIVVMGAAQWSGRPSPVYRTRLDQAFYLWEREVAPVVVVTGGQGGEGETTEAKVGYTYLRQQGIPDEALLLEVQGRSTWQSLKASAVFLSQRNIHDVVVVSDGWHLARAKAMAERLGLQVRTSAATASALSEEKERRAILREIVALSVGRIIGFDRLDRLGH